MQLPIISFSTDSLQALQFLPLQVRRSRPSWAQFGRSQAGTAHVLSRQNDSSSPFLLSKPCRAAPLLLFVYKRPKAVLEGPRADRVAGRGWEAKAKAVPSRGEQLE